MTRFNWDPRKDSLLRKNKRRGNIGFFEVVQVFRGPHCVEIRSDDPLQFFAIGWVQLSLYTVVFEMRSDSEGEFYHLITFWKSNSYERELYAKEYR